MIEDAGESDFHAVHDDSVVAMTITMKITLVAAMLKMVSLMAMLIQLVMVLMAATVVEVMSMLTSGTSGIYWQCYSSRQQCSSMIYIYIYVLLFLLVPDLLVCFAFMTKVTAEENSTMSELLRVTRHGGIVVFSMRPPGWNRGA